MIFGLIVTAGGFSVTYNLIKSKMGKLTSKGKTLRNIFKTFLGTSALLVSGYLLIHIFILGG